MVTNLEEEFKKYWAIVEQHAEERFRSKIVPWLKKNELDFRAGNGTYWIGTELYSLDDDDIPKKFLDIMAEEIPGTTQCLGSVMPDFDVVGE